jgi:hypothetical protein
MFAALSFALFLAADEAVPKPAVVETCPVELAQVITHALDDFETSYSELGLLGAAPLLGREPVAEEDPVVTTHAEFDGSAWVAPARLIRTARR